MRDEGTVTESNECMSMECKAFVQLDVQSGQCHEFQEGGAIGAVDDETSLEITIMTFNRAVPQKFYVLTERVKRNC